MNITKGFTKEKWIEKRVAEGFTVEYATDEYDGKQDLEVLTSQEQHIPTKGEMVQLVNEAILNNPNRQKTYTPDFKLSKEYKELYADAQKAQKAGDWEKAEPLAKLMIGIQTTGTLTYDERQAEIDKSIDMPIASVFSEYKKHKAIVTDCEKELDEFDVSVVQVKVDELTTEYENKRKSNAGKWAVLDKLNAEYQEAVDTLEKDLIIIPMNEIKLKRYKANELLLIYEARIKYYINANRALVEEEVQNAKRMEVRGSLVDLVGFIEEGR
ncbi:MAG: hypothetical protein R3Y09_00105 [Clostridia bacterium]